jgi:hypothetical protein
MEIWPQDPWALFSRKAGVVYAACILLTLAGYAYSNRLAPVVGTVSCVVFISVLAAFLLLAGTSQLTWTDPSNALAILLIASAFFLDGIFIAGASTFGPVETLDVGVLDWSGNPNDVYFWVEGRWMEAKLSQRISAQETKMFLSWCGNSALTNDLNSKPGRIQMSTWDRQVYRVTMKNWTPPTTIGELPSANPRSFLELLCGLVLLALSLFIWREGRRRGIRYRAQPLALVADSTNP